MSVDSLARELGVSQTPIREALSMLEANGLVSKRHFAGYATSPRMDRAQLDELFEFRLLIEPHAARKAAEAMSEADMARAGQRRDGAVSHDAFADMDTEFPPPDRAGRRQSPDRGFAWRGCISMSTSSAPVSAARSRKRRCTSMTPSSPPSARATARRAEAAMRRHIERIYRRLRDFIKD